MLKDAEARIKAQVWQAIAQGEIDLSVLSKEQTENLIDLVTQAALLEVDAELDQSLGEALKESAFQGGDAQPAGLVSPVPEADPNDDVEVILWEGRPLLSLTLKYIITDERIRIIEGMIGKKRHDIELVRIQSIDQSQNVSERMMMVGDIIIRSHDPKHQLVVLNNVRDPETVHEILRRAVLKARDKYKLSYREEM